MLLEIALTWETLGEHQKAIEAVAEAERVVRRENFFRSWLRMLPGIGNLL